MRRFRFTRRLPFGYRLVRPEYETCRTLFLHPVTLRRLRDEARRTGLEEEDIVEAALHELFERSVIVRHQLYERERQTWRS